jgi:DNA mismatch repair ATPase MutS
MLRRVTENKKSGGGATEKVVTRELTQVMTKGTLQDDDEGLMDERILMCIRK